MVGLSLHPTTNVAELVTQQITAVAGLLARQQQNRVARRNSAIYQC